MGCAEVPLGADLRAEYGRLSGMAAEVLLRLTVDEALVLYEWLHRTDDDPGYDGIVADHAEKVALWNLSALLERELIEPFQDAYSQRVAAAKTRLTTT
jgi:hypothetical protein